MGPCGDCDARSDAAAQRGIPSEAPLSDACGSSSAAEGGVCGDATSEEGSSRSLPTTPEAFREWITGEFRNCPSYAAYPQILEQAADVVCKWRNRFQEHRTVWSHIMRNNAVLKEINECAPVIAFAIDAVQRLQLSGDELPEHRIVILDLCSGYGYMSMLLSELLPPEKITSIVLVDHQWPMLNQEPQPHHINWEHLRVSGWPIPMETSKQDLKSSYAQRALEKFLFRADQTFRPVVILGVHLCSTLSIRAVEIFNKQPNAVALALKPCCLPPVGFIREKKVWELGSHRIPAREVCAKGKWNKGTWSGESRVRLKTVFERWSQHLHDGVEPAEGADAVVKELVSIQVQQQASSYQNAFIFAERECFSTVWSSSAPTGDEPAAEAELPDGIGAGEG